MEIGSMNGMQQGMRMEGMRPPPPKGDPAEHAEEMSAKIMEQQDADGDGLLSTGEFDSDLLAALDEDGDGVLSQTELQTGIQSKMEEGKAAFEAGEMPSDENREFMQQMHSLAGESMLGDSGGSRAKASEAYQLMQDAMFGGNQDSSTFNTDQMLLDQLNLAV